jgi:hypothetical protein
LSIFCETFVYRLIWINSEFCFLPHYSISDDLAEIFYLFCHHLAWHLWITSREISHLSANALYISHLNQWEFKNLPLKAYVTIDCHHRLVSLNYWLTFIQDALGWIVLSWVLLSSLGLPHSLPKIQSCFGCVNIIS